VFRRAGLAKKQEVASTIALLFSQDAASIADLNLNEIDQELTTPDVSGHYSRSDVFTFETKVNQSLFKELLSAELTG
jgi:hypothetical protein